jgi:hypothetical protein
VSSLIPLSGYLRADRVGKYPALHGLYAKEMSDTTATAKAFVFGFILAILPKGVRDALKNSLGALDKFCRFACKYRDVLYPG